MARVVDEAEIDIGVVDGRVPALRVVADVERVIRPLGDLQAGLVRGVEDRRRDLADAAAEAGRHLAVDDHRRLEESLRRRALAGRLVERELLAGRDQLVVDEMRDELRRCGSGSRSRRRRSCSVETTPWMPSAAASSVVSFACCSCTGRTVTRRVGARVERRREDRGRGGGGVEPDAGLRGDDGDVRAVDGEGRVLRRRLDAAADAAAARASAAGPPICSAVWPPDGSSSSRASRCGWIEPALDAELERDGAGERDARLARRRARARRRGRAARRRAAAAVPGRRCGSSDASDVDDRASRRRRGRGRVPRAPARRRRSGRAGRSRRSRLLRSTAFAIWRSSYCSAPWRTRVGGVTSAPKTSTPMRLEAAQRAEAVALALRGVDRGVPVRLDAELGRRDREPLAGGGEDDRLPREARPTSSSSRACALVASRPPTSIPSMRTPLGDRRRRAGEDEAEHDHRADDDGSDQHEPAGGRRPAAPGATRRNSLSGPAHRSMVATAPAAVRGVGLTFTCSLRTMSQGLTPGRVRQKTKSSTPPATFSSMPVM